MTDKQKRFRVHVVKEILDTEREYTRSLEFTVTHILEKAREKERNPHESTFTADNIRTLFCNIEEILAVHQSLMKDLEKTVASKGPVYETEVAACYLKHKEGLLSYKKYGENNEQAQKLFYELQKQPSFEAFFYGCMLLGGKGDEEISAYFFKPIQRVCKYPLLFRELEKYTPTGHPDYQPTQDALEMMRETCSTINEAKRRVEHLEQIADWQATVEQWEGPNVVDTCNQRIKEGPLVKISAGNTQERQFYLFDNLLVYCKKRGRNGAVFRGRVSVEGLDIEDIQDGTADFHSNGLTVVNGWKVHNIAKDKWFVLLAKTPQEKQEWVDAIRREKEKKKRVAAGIAQATRDLMLTRGERYHAQMLQDKVIKDNRVKLRTYQDSFSGQDMVNWLIKKKEAQNTDAAIILGQALVDSGMMHHVNDKHQFKNTADILYRFRYDDKTYKGKLESSDVITRGIRVYCRLHGLFDPLLKDQRVGVSRTALYCVVNSQRMIDWWCDEKDISTRAEGVALGKELYATGILRHATDPSQNFKDAAEFYRFTADEGHEGGEKGRKSTLAPVPSKKNFGVTSDSQCKTFTLLFSPLDHSHGVELGVQEPGPQFGNQRQVIVKYVSQGAQVCGLRVGQQVVAINGQPITTHNPTEYFGALKVTGEVPPPLYLTIVRRSSEFAVLSPQGSSLGFNVKGSAPVIISSTDKGSAAAQAGIVASSCILKVGDEDVLLGSHDRVVSAVKKALTSSAGSEGGAKVELKLSNPFMEHITSYSYETSDSTPISVHERTIESPYIFSVPAQLLKLYEEEMKDVVSLVEQVGVSDTRVKDYLHGLKSISEVYNKTFVALSGPRWPTYKVYGNNPPIALEACATNLHTCVLDVVNSGISSPPISPTSPASSFEESTTTDDGSLPTLKSHTSYCISTMAVPSIDEKPLTKDCELLKDVEIRRDLLYTLRNHLREMIAEQEAVKRMIQELNPAPAHQMIPNGSCNDADDLTPVHTPTNSPSTIRKRIVSVSNPEPVIKLLVQGVLQKVGSFLEYLDDKLLLSVVEECDGIVKTTAQDELKGYKARLKSLSEEVKVLAKRSLGEPLNRSTRTLVETVQKIIQELSSRVWISIALCDKTSLIQNVDKVFAQCLTSVVTAFGHHLVKAGRGHLNPGVDYEEDNREASLQWLQMISKKGVLLHMQSTLIPTNEREFGALRDFKHVLSKVEKVKLFVKPEDKEEPYSLPLHYSELPPVKLEGDRNEVHITFFVSRSLFKQLPESIMVSQGIKIVPILFNRGLQDFQEGLDVYCKERDLNMESFQKLKNYYQALRRFRLDKSNLPTDSDAKCLAVHKISRPLNAMDLLMRQIEVAVKEPTKPGVGLLTIAAELATRMGALRVNICDSGVFRSSLATSLEQVMVLGRCHGLPFRSFRSTLNTLRRNGGLICLAKKNNADQSKSLPKQTPKLYRIPPAQPTKT